MREHLSDALTELPWYKRKLREYYSFEVSQKRGAVTVILLPPAQLHFLN